MNYQPQFDRRVFWIFVIIHALVWILLPTFLRHNVPFDTIEGIAWGDQWQWGYDKHPPLAAWLCALFTQVGGVVGWPVYVLAQGAVVTAFWAVWKVSNRFLSPLESLIAVFSLEGIIYFNVLTPKINPTTLMTPIWALLVLFTYRALSHKRRLDWILAGIFAGLSILTKYEAPLILLSLGMVTILTAEGRAAFRETGIYLAGFIALLVVYPHFYWTFQQQATEFSYAFHQLNAVTPSIREASFWTRHLYYPVMFLITELGAMSGAFIILMPLLFCQRRAIDLDSFDRQFLGWVALGPLGLTLLFSLVTGSYLYTKWGTPFLSFMTVFLLAFIPRHLSLRAFKQTVVLFIMIGLGFPFVRGYYLSQGLNPKADAYFPGPEIAQTLTTLWHEKTHQPLRYIAGDHYLVANIAVYSKDKPAPFMAWQLKESPWINVSKMRHEGALFVWFMDAQYHEKSLPKAVKEAYPRLRYWGIYSFEKQGEHLSKATPKINIGVAYLPAESYLSRNVMRPLLKS